MMITTTFTDAEHQHLLALQKDTGARDLGSVIKAAVAAYTPSVVVNPKAQAEQPTAENEHHD